MGIGTTTPLIPDALHVASISKTILPGTLTVLGGTHATILPVETIKSTNDIDVIVRAEGEITMSEICKKKPLKKIAGINFKHGKHIISNPDRSMISDIDNIPLPARNLFDMKYYLKRSPGVIRGIELKATHIFTSRGCPYHCSFCAGSVAFGKKLRFHSVERVIKEIKAIISNYDVEGIYFAEDMFSAYRQRAIDICKAIIKEKINKQIVWCAQLRVNNLDKELLSIMKKAGCVQVEYGFESGSQRMLDLMEKLTTVEQNYQAAKITKEIGIRFLADIIVGMPTETKKDFMATINMIKDTKPDYIGFNKFIPLPGSKMFDYLRKRGEIKPDWLKYNVGVTNNQEINFTNMSNQEFFSLYNKFNKELVQPLIDKNYFKYNVLRKPLPMIKTVIERFSQNPMAVVNRIIKAG